MAILQRDWKKLPGGNGENVFTIYDPALQLAATFADFAGFTPQMTHSMAVSFKVSETTSITSVRAEVDPNAEDVGWMRLVATGDERAFRKLVEKHQAAVIGTIAKMTSRPGEAEDLAQQVFLRVWKSAPRYEPSAKFTTWLYTIVRNLVFNESRRMYRKMEVSMEAREEDSHQELADGSVNQPDQEALLSELRIAADAAIAELPEQARLAVIMRRFENSPYEDIADVLGLTVPAVKSLLFRARVVLRERLGVYLGDG